MVVDAQRLRDLPGNDRCADCQDCDCPDCGGFPDPVWACEELGILVCEECMDLHTTLTSATFKSVICQDWTEESYQRMASTNNHAANELYEKHLCPAYKKPTRCFNLFDDDPSFASDPSTRETDYVLCLWNMQEVPRLTPLIRPRYRLPVLNEKAASFSTNRRDFRKQWLVSKYVRKEFMSAERMPHYVQGRKSGYLWKLGRDSQMFQKRWFVLDPSGRGMLRYYTDANEQSIRGEIPVFKMNLELAPQEKIKNPYGLQIIAPDKKAQNTRMIYLYAEVAKDMVEWYQAVRCVKYNIQIIKNVDKDDTFMKRILQYEILKEGYLFKTGAKGKEAFRKRWIVLDRICLMYFKDPLDANPKGTIPMRAGYSLILSGQMETEHRGYHFFLKTPARTYHFISENDHERKSWFMAIHTACNRLAGYDKRPKDNPNLLAQKWLSRPTAETSPKTTRKAPKIQVASSGEGASATTEMAKLGSPGSTPEADTDEDSELLSHPFVGVRPSTKPRPAHTLHEPKHGRPAKPGRYNSPVRGPSPVPKQPGVQEHEDDYIAFEPGTFDSDYVLEQEDIEATSEEDDEDEESPYIELEGEKMVMMQTVDIIGMTTKQQSTHLKVPRRALPQASSCTMCVSLVWNMQPILPDSEDCVSVSPIVSCCSMPRDIALLQPYQLEIQHSAILKDVATCRPDIWYLDKQPGKFFKWEKIDQTSGGVACKASHRNFVIETAKTGCFTVMVQADSVAGKMIRCMIYISSEQGDDHLVARVYFFSDNGSDDVIHEIQRRENGYRGRLCDVSGSFFFANTEGNILMTMSDFEGMKMYFGGNDPMTIPADELWHKQLMCYMVEITKLDSAGQCNVNIWQENTPSQNEPIQMYLQFSNREKYPAIAAVPFIQPHIPLPAAFPVRVHQPLTRVSSEPPSSQACARLIANRQRDDPHARSVPTTHGKGAKTSHLTEESLSENILPFSVKRELFLLLDQKVAAGNDWRMLASQIGLDAMIYCFDMYINPTMEVLRAFEVMARPITELEAHMRHMGRNDAADVIKRYIKSRPNVGVDI